MADYSGTLKKFRESGYPKDAGQADENPSDPASSGIRTIKLTDDEAKELGQSGQPGDEVECTVSGKIEGNTLRVMSVSSPGADDQNPDANADAEAVMSKFRQGPMVQSQTIPSPS